MQRDLVLEAYEICRHWTNDRDLFHKVSAVISALLILPPHKDRMPCKLERLGKCCAICGQLQLDMKSKYKDAPVDSEEQGLRVAYEVAFGVLPIKAVQDGSWRKLYYRDQGHQQRHDVLTRRRVTNDRARPRPLV
jgi:hypothetical protein